MAGNRAGRPVRRAKLSREIRDIGKEAGLFLKKTI
jgi:hypothetical protein